MATDKIEELIRKGKTEGLTPDETNYLEFLLIDLLNRDQEELTEKERKLLNSYHLYLKSKDKKLFEKEEMQEMAQRSFRKLVDKLQIEEELLEQPAPTIPLPTPHTIKRRIIPAVAGIAAAIALLIAVGIPFLKRSGTGEAASTELLVQSQIEKQFITKGNMKRVTLGDGSVVHLNMGTTLSLHKGKFNAYTREVWLDEGEAFFEVAKDKNRPFIVHTADGLSTQVLGTSFNIKAYQELGEQVVSVKTGRVQVSSDAGDKVVLDPNSKASFDADKGTLTAGITDGTAAAEWRTGTVVLDDANLKEIAFRLKQYYDVEVQVRNQAIPHDTQLDMTFNAATPLKTVAKRMAQMYKIQYRISEQTITFYK